MRRIKGPRASRVPGSCYKTCVLTGQDRDAVGVKRELRRRWFYLLPAVFVTYSLAYLDRANYGFGAAAGLAKTLHITNSQTALLGSLFFLGYFFFQVPGIAYARRKSASRLVFYSLILWGILAALTGVIHQFWLLAIDRLLLGVAESLIFPAMLILITNWFTRDRTIAGQRDPHSRQPDHGAMDVSCNRLSDQGRRLADDVCDRGTSLGPVGLRLVLRCSRSAGAGFVAQPGCEQTSRERIGARTACAPPEPPTSLRPFGSPAFCCSAYSFFAGALASTASCCGCRR